MRTLLLESEGSVVTSEIARIELASAVMSASRTGRAHGWQSLMATMEVDIGPDGPIALITLRREVILPTAYRLVMEYRLSTLDAIHLAVATQECPGLALGGRVEFITFDRDQAAAAADLDLVVR